MSYTTAQLFHKRRFVKLLQTLILISLGCTLIIYPLEAPDPHSKIKTLFDSFWWVVQTVTTIGYGDYVPVTIPGRVLGIFLQFVGSTLYSIMFVIVGSTMAESTDNYRWHKLDKR